MNEEPKFMNSNSQFGKQTRDKGGLEPYELAVKRICAAAKEFQATVPDGEKPEFTPLCHEHPGVYIPVSVYCLNMAYKLWDDVNGPKPPIGSMMLPPGMIPPGMIPAGVVQFGPQHQHDEDERADDEEEGIVPRDGFASREAMDNAATCCNLSVRQPAARNLATGSVSLFVRGFCCTFELPG